MHNFLYVAMQVCMDIITDTRETKKNAKWVRSFLNEDYSPFLEIPLRRYYVYIYFTQFRTSQIHP